MKNSLITGFICGVIFICGAGDVLASNPLVSSNGVRIDEIVPQEIYVEAGQGKQTVVLLKGEGLRNLNKARIYQGGNMVNKILVRFSTSKDDNRRSMTLMAAPDVLPGSDYRIVFWTRDNQQIRFPGKIQVVSEGDERAQKVDLDDVGKMRKMPKKLVVDPRDLPEVFESDPSPLVVPVDGLPHQVILKGRNLDKISEICLRKEAEERIYRRRNLIPFEKIEEGLALQLVATSDTPIGSEFCLDFLVGKFIVGTVSFKVTEVTTVSQVTEIQTVSRPQVQAQEPPVEKEEPSLEKKKGLLDDILNEGID